MNKNDNLGLHGQFVLVAAHSDGEVFATREIKNLITTAGLAEVAKMLIGAASDGFDYVAIGIGNTAPNIADTTLDSEITTNGGARAQSSTESTTAAVATIPVTFNFTGSFAVVEVGLLNAASTGDLLARQIFAAINVASGDSLTATWTITSAGV